MKIFKRIFIFNIQCNRFPVFQGIDNLIHNNKRLIKRSLFRFLKNLIGSIFSIKIVRKNRIDCLNIQ